MAAHHGSSHKVQDPYSLRCVPQVHGAVRDALDYLGRVLDVELNSATDNPLIFPEGGAAAADVAATGGGLVISGGNFHGEPIALALDFAKLAIAELGAISERRVALLLDARLNGGLPPFLAPASGLNSGMMLLQYTAAALASENKVLVHPASADSIPTSANQEDHVSMGSIAGRHARDVLANVERILAIELLAGAQALDLRLATMSGATGGTPAGPRVPGAFPAPAPAPGRGVAEAHRRIRSVVAPLLVDREMGADIAAALALVRGGELADLVDAPGAASPGAG
jgi:histidine ammonia-lyase